MKKSLTLLAFVLGCGSVFAQTTPEGLWRNIDDDTGKPMAEIRISLVNGALSGVVEKALVEMWIRRMEFQIWRPIGMVWRHADPRTAFLGGQFPDFGEANREASFAAMRWLDRELADGRDFLTGHVFSIADIVGLCGVDFAAFIGLAVPADCPHLLAWHGRVSARPNARA